VGQPTDEGALAASGFEDCRAEQRRYIGPWRGKRPPFRRLLDRARARSGSTWASAARAHERDTEPRRTHFCRKRGGAPRATTPTVRCCPWQTEGATRTQLAPKGAQERSGTRRLRHPRLGAGATNVAPFDGTSCGETLAPVEKHDRRAGRSSAGRHLRFVRGDSVLEARGNSRIRPIARALTVALKGPSARNSPRPGVASCAVCLGCVIVAFSRFQVGMNARREAL
jgi:hypothetical protein